MNMFRTRGLRRAVSALAVFAALACGSASYAADTLNVYTIWSERYATEVFKAFTKDTGIQVRHLRFSSGEVLARIIGEKDNPQVDVFFGGRPGLDEEMQVLAETIPLAILARPGFSMRALESPAALRYHNRRIAAELGFGAADIEAMVRDGVLYQEAAVAELEA